MKTTRKKTSAATREYLHAVAKIIHWAKRAERAREQIIKQAEQREGGEK